MSLPVTYQALINRTANWLENNCINSYTKWGSCPVWCKNGYRTNYIVFAGNTDPDKNYLKGSRFRYVLTNGISNGLGQNAILNQLNTYIDGLGATRSSLVPASEIIDVMNVLGRFCALHVYFMGNFNSDDPDNIANNTAKVTRTKNTNTYLVYRTESNNIPFVLNNPISLSHTADYDVVESSDVNKCINTVVKVMLSELRVISAQYRIELSST